MLAIKAFEAASDTGDNATVDDAQECLSRGKAKKAALGDSDEDENEQFERVMKLAEGFVKEMSSEAEIKPDPRHIKELLRFGKAKLHNIGSYLGGVAATEACKLIMSQYLPMNNTLVFDGIHSTGTVFTL